MRDYEAKTVDEYIANAPAKAQPKLKEIRELIKECVPEAEESISWGIPFYKYHGMLGGFSVFTNHTSFGMGGPVLESRLREKLEKEGYTTGKKVIQIKFDQALPKAEIEKILIEQAEANKSKR